LSAADAAGPIRRRAGADACRESKKADGDPHEGPLGLTYVTRSGAS